MRFRQLSHPNLQALVRLRVPVQTLQQCHLPLLVRIRLDRRVVLPLHFLPHYRVDCRLHHRVGVLDHHRSPVMLLPKVLPRFLVHLHRRSQVFTLRPTHLKLPVRRLRHYPA